jgi:hypothetical protein
MAVKNTYKILGYQQINDLSAAIGLTVPAGSLAALIQCLDQNARWRGDGVAPSATVGMRIANGDTIYYDGDLMQIRFIEETAGAELNVTFLQ